MFGWQARVSVCCFRDCSLHSNGVLRSPGEAERRIVVLSLDVFVLVGTNIYPVLANHHQTASSVVDLTSGYFSEVESQVASTFFDFRLDEQDITVRRVRVS